MNPELKALAEAAEKSQKLAYEAQATYETAAEEVVRQAKSIPEDHRILLGTWECEESPTGRCAYDMTDDERMGDDECVFCGHPDERK